MSDCDILVAAAKARGVDVRVTKIGNTFVVSRDSGNLVLVLDANERIGFANGFWLAEWLSGLNTEMLELQ